MPRRSRLAAGVRAAAMSVVLCWVLSGCIGGDVGPAVFVGRDTSSALLVQWTDNGKGVLTGSVQIADKAPGLTGEPVKQTRLTFSGSLKSGKVSLDVNQELGGIQSWNGTLDGDELRVNVPEGASSETITLTRASAADFNADVAALEAAVVKARDEATRAADSAERLAEKEESEAARQRSFDDAVRGVSVARETVLALLLVPPELEGFAEDLDAARADLAKVKTAAEEAASRNRGFVACEFASQAEAAANDVASDASQLKDNARALKQKADALADARVELSQAFARLQQLSAPDGQSSKPDPAVLTALIAKAKGTAEGWRSAASKADKEMKSIVLQANKLAGNAETASC